MSTTETFDFEAFIEGAELAQAKVGFFRKDHRVEIADLTRQHDALPVTADDERESSGEHPRKVLAQKIADLRAQMEASRVEMTIRSLTPDEFKSLSKDDDDDVYRQLEMQSVSPKLDRDQWRKLADRIGLAQFSRITNDANELTLSKVAVPDFSRSVSRTLSPSLPSES